MRDADHVRAHVRVPPAHARALSPLPLVRHESLARLEARGREAPLERTTPRDARAQGATMIRTAHDVVPWLRGLGYNKTAALLREALDAQEPRRVNVVIVTHAPTCPHVTEGGRCVCAVG